MPESKAASRAKRISEPFGTRVDAAGLLVPEPAELKAIVRMRKLRAEGWPLRKIAADLAKRGHSVSHEGVKVILARKHPLLPEPD